MLLKNVRLTKEQRKRFFKTTFETKNIEFNDDLVVARSGLISYDAWSKNERIYVQFSFCGNILSSAYFNAETFEYDSKYTDMQN